MCNGRRPPMRSLATSRQPPSGFVHCHNGCDDRRDCRNTEMHWQGKPPVCPLRNRPHQDRGCKLLAWYPIRIFKNRHFRLGSRAAVLTMRPARHSESGCASPIAGEWGVAACGGPGEEERRAHSSRHDVTERAKRRLQRTESPRPNRCAIYTRKSSEEGLEQAFNSLDAQREACAAFIMSQKHEGWTVLPALYDDGGFSGGTMERPALKRLMADIEAGQIDVVVVYKVDRLTRALSDFAKLVDVLDRCGMSFVSITQQFNTTTSMGRLTLNVLLSFAQFEREVTRWCRTTGSIAPAWYPTWRPRV